MKGLYFQTLLIFCIAMILSCVSNTPKSVTKRTSVSNASADSGNIDEGSNDQRDGSDEGNKDLDFENCQEIYGGTPHVLARMSPTPGWKRASDTDWKAAVNPLAKGLEATLPGEILELQAGVYPRFSQGANDGGWPFYNAGAYNAFTAGGTREAPITVRAALDPVSGHYVPVTVDRPPGGENFPVYFLQDMSGGKGGWITFIGIKFLTGSWGAMFFIKSGDAGENTHEGYTFCNVEIDGQWAHYLPPEGADGSQDFAAWCSEFNQGKILGRPTASGAYPSKWGIHAHFLKDFVFAYGYVHNIMHEHGFYLHNLKGNLHIVGNKGDGLGRNFVQVTNRDWERIQEPTGLGTVYIKHNDVHNTSLTGGPNFVSIYGHTGSVVIEENRFEQGYDPKYLPNPYAAEGGGVLADSGGVWSDNEHTLYTPHNAWWPYALYGHASTWPYLPLDPNHLNTPSLAPVWPTDPDTGISYGLQQNGTVILRDNVIRMNPDPDPAWTNNLCGQNAGKTASQLTIGDRSVVKFSATRKVILERNHIQSGSLYDALTLDSFTTKSDGTKTLEDPLNWIVEGSDNEIVGKKNCFFDCPVLE